MSTCPDISRRPDNSTLTTSLGENQPAHMTNRITHRIVYRCFYRGVSKCLPVLTM